MFPVHRMFLLVPHVLFVQVHAFPTVSHYGTEFYLYGCVEYYGAHNDLIIDIASKHESSMQLMIPYLSINRNSTISRGVTTVPVSGTLLRSGTFLENRGILIRTYFPVAVYVTCVGVHDVIDTYLALPITALGTSYKVASYAPYSSSEGVGAFLSIVGVMADTFATTNFTYTTSKVSHLQQFSVQQFESTTDLSNTFVVSNKLISIISGTACAYVPHGVQACDLLLEHMLPVRYWKKNYIVPPIFPKLGFVLKILTAHNETFCLRNNTNTICDTSNGSPQQEFLMGTEPVVVTSPVPISTVQFGLGRDYDKVGGDEFMTVIPAVEHYLNEYYFVVPSNYSSLQSYLSIIITSSQINGIKLDGYSITILKQYSVSDPYSEFSVLIVNISVGYHELYHTNRTVKFGVTIYGLSNYTEAVGYGFPAGYAFTTDTDEMTTSTPTISTFSISSNTAVAIPSTTSPPNSTTRTICFSCEDMSHAEFCDTIEQCNEHQVCYLEKFTKSAGHIFRSGCLEKQKCIEESAVSTVDRCVHCCSDDFCNNQGCGEIGLQPREQRGPMCYDCQHVGALHECHTVTLCSSGQICSIEEFEWGTSSHFKMGCAHGLCNPIDRSVHVHVAPRALPVCHACCTDDYCNSNCTRDAQGKPGVEIIG